MDGGGQCGNGNKCRTNDAAGGRFDTCFLLSCCHAMPCSGPSIKMDEMLIGWPPQQPKLKQYEQRVCFFEMGKINCECLSRRLTVDDLTGAHDSAELMGGKTIGPTCLLKSLKRLIKVSREISIRFFFHYSS